MRHTPEHDVWAPDGRCDVLVTEPDGTLTRCGHVPGRPSYDPSPPPLAVTRPGEGHAVRNVIIGVIVALVGLAIALDWLAFVLFVSRNDLDPKMAIAFIMRVAASVGYGAAVGWLWRHR